jgi:hypothetical protein
MHHETRNLVLVLGAYFLACEETPHLQPEVAMWPSKTWLNVGFGAWLGVPFVDFRAPDAQPPPPAPPLVKMSLPSPPSR